MYVYLYIHLAHKDEFSFPSLYLVTSSFFFRSLQVRNNNNPFALMWACVGDSHIWISHAFPCVWARTSLKCNPRVHFSVDRSFFYSFAHPDYFYFFRLVLLFTIGVMHSACWHACFLCRHFIKNIGWTDFVLSFLIDTQNKFLIFRNYNYLTM